MHTYIHERLHPAATLSSVTELAGLGHGGLVLSTLVCANQKDRTVVYYPNYRFNYLVVLLWNPPQQVGGR